MRLIAILLAVAGCGGGEGGDPHGLVDCDNTPDGRCERACVGVDVTGTEMCSIQLPSGTTSSCSPVTEYEGVRGCCRDLVGDDVNALTFTECED